MTMSGRTKVRRDERTAMTELNLYELSKTIGSLQAMAAEQEKKYDLINHRLDVICQTMATKDDINSVLFRLERHIGGADCEAVRANVDKTANLDHLVTAMEAERAIIKGSLVAIPAFLVALLEIAKYFYRGHWW